MKPALPQNGSRQSSAEDGVGGGHRDAAYGEQDGPVSDLRRHWTRASQSLKQRDNQVARSSTVLQVQRILDFLNIATRPAIIFQDNLSTKFMAEAGRGGKTGHFKHINVRFFFVYHLIVATD